MLCLGMKRGSVLLGNGGRLESACVGWIAIHVDFACVFVQYTGFFFLQMLTGSEPLDFISVVNPDLMVLWLMV